VNRNEFIKLASVGLVSAALPVAAALPEPVEKFDGVMKLKTVDDVIACFKKFKDFNVFCCDDIARRRIGWCFVKNVNQLNELAFNPTMDPLDLIESAKERSPDFGAMVEACLTTDEGRLNLTLFFETAALQAYVNEAKALALISCFS